MQGVDGIENNSGRACAAKGRGDLSSDIPRLSYPDNDNFSPDRQNLQESSNGMMKLRTESGGDSSQRRLLDGKNLAGAVQVIHEEGREGKFARRSKNNRITDSAMWPKNSGRYHVGGICSTTSIARTAVD